MKNLSLAISVTVFIMATFLPQKETIDEVKSMIEQQAKKPKLQSIISVEKKVTLNNKTIALPDIATIGSYVHFSSEGEKLPVIMIAGLGLSSWIFTDTPDNRESWATTFSNNGHEVYVYNDPSIFINPELDYSEYLDQTSKWQEGRAWSTWGMGPQYPNPYENTRYPVQEFDSLVKNFPPYTSFGFLESTSGAQGRGRGGSETSIGTEIKINNLLSLIDQVGDCVLLVHSMSGTTGFEAIKKDSEHIKALIVIEPVGSPTNEIEIKKYFSTIPFLGVYGDFIDQRRQTSRKVAVEKTIEIIRANNGKADMIDLPKLGIEGNTHLLMQDDNNVVIGELIINWLSEIKY